jgi:hypothetical protein
MKALLTNMEHCFETINTHIQTILLKLGEPTRSILNCQQIATRKFRNMEQVGVLMQSFSEAKTKMHNA